MRRVRVDGAYHSIAEPPVSQDQSASYVMHRYKNKYTHIYSVNTFNELPLPTTIQDPPLDGQYSKNAHTSNAHSAWRRPIV